MVAPRPLEPLVLYLAATPYSASAALVAVREEHRAKGALRRATTKAMQDQEGAARAVAAPTEDQAQQDAAAKIPAITITGSRRSSQIKFLIKSSDQ